MEEKFENHIAGFILPNNLLVDKFTCTHRGKIQAKSNGVVDMYVVS
jgi:hypothetical protein